LDREKAFFSHIENDHIAGVLEKYRVNCVLDVGANRGQYSRRLRAAGYSGYIVSFEPVPHLFEKLEQNASGDPKWTVHRVALGAEDDVTSMHVVPQTAKGWQGGLSSILAPTAYGKGRYGVLRETVTEEVPLRRLDGLLDSVIAHVPDPRIYLKLDTQGGTIFRSSRDSAAGRPTSWACSPRSRWWSITRGCRGCRRRSRSTRRLDSRLVGSSL